MHMFYSSNAFMSDLSKQQGFTVTFLKKDKPACEVVLFPTISGSWQTLHGGNMRRRGRRCSQSCLCPWLATCPEALCLDTAVETSPLLLRHPSPLLLHSAAVHPQVTNQKGHLLILLSTLMSSSYQTSDIQSIINTSTAKWHWLH